MTDVPCCAACRRPLDEVLARRGYTLHPCCDPGGAELYCLACGHARDIRPGAAASPAACRCAQPKLWRPSDKALAPTAARAAELLTPGAPAGRVIACTRGGKRPTDRDLDLLNTALTELRLRTASGRPAQIRRQHR